MATKIKRFTPVLVHYSRDNPSVQMLYEDNGKYVSYEDHIRFETELRKEIGRLWGIIHKETKF